MSSGRVTAILLNYARPDNLRLLIEELRGQTEPPEIWVIDNAGRGEFGADRTVHIPWNAGVSIRVLMAVYVATPWVMFLDDDLAPCDEQFIEDALGVATERPNVITGAYGRRLAGEWPQYREDAWGAVEIIKGRFMLFRRAILDNVRLPAVPPDLDVRFCEDIHLSLEAGRGEPVHWADRGLLGRLRDLPGWDGGLSSRAGHDHERNRFCEWWMKERRA